jgi:hypothetical protein
MGARDESVIAIIMAAACGIVIGMFLMLVIFGNKIFG